MNAVNQPRPSALATLARSTAEPARTAPAVVDQSVIIPVYNESDRLAATLAEVRAHLNGAGGAWELIVVDDGSRDDSAAIAARFAAGEPRIRLLRTPRNRGKGHAVRHGVLASRGRRVLYCDADLATPIGEMDRLHAKLDAGFAGAIGSRVGPHADIRRRQPLPRVLLGRLGNRLIRLAAVPGIGDTQCGFKLFDGDKARRAFTLTRVDGWAFDVEVLYLFARGDWPVAEVPVRWSHRAGSKVRMRDYPATLAELLRMRWRHRGAPPRVRQQ